MQAEYHVTMEAFWSDASTSQETPGFAGNRWKLGDDKEGFSLRAFGESMAVPTPWF